MEKILKKIDKAIKKVEKLRNNAENLQIESALTSELMGMNRIRDLIISQS